MHRILTIAFVALALAGCKADRYQPYYYPDGSNLRVSVTGPEFATVEEARNWVAKLDLTFPKRGGVKSDYEIGKNPRPMFPELGDDGIYISDETFR